MTLSDIIRLSKSALFERKSRTILTIVMVMVGTSLIIALDGLSAGQAAFVQNQLNKLAPNVLSVSPGQRGFRDAESTPSIIFNSLVVDRLKSLTFVTDVIPTYQGGVTLESQGSRIGASVMGIDPQKLTTIFPSLELTDGSLIKAGDPSAILVGDSIANPPGKTSSLVTLGQTVRLTLNYVDSVTGKQTQQTKTFIVSGILLPTGNNQVDRAIIINMIAADSLLHKGGKYDGLSVISLSADYNDSVQQEITALYGNTIGVSTQKAVLAARQQFVSGNAAFIQSVGMIALVVGTIGIITTLYTSVNERTREIGTMKAIGAQGRFILALFLSEAIIIGLIGATVGLLTGILGGYILTSGLLPSQPGPGGGGGAGARLTPVFILSDLVYVWTLSLALSVMAGLFPAWKASRLTPLTALRRD